MDDSENESKIEWMKRKEMRKRSSDGKQKQTGRKRKAEKNDKPRSCVAR